MYDADFLRNVTLGINFGKSCSVTLIVTSRHCGHDICLAFSNWEMNKKLAKCVA